MHTDAVQAAGKIPLCFRDSGLHLMSMASHKLHGPKGLGVLVVKSGMGLVPWMQGGQQEGGWRAGTENVPAIVGSGAAAAMAAEALPAMASRVCALRDRLEQGIAARVERVRIVGCDVPRLPNTSTLLIDGIQAEALIARMDMAGICCSSGSACAAGSPEPSHVLTAMGIDPTRARGAIRLSLSRYTSDTEIDAVLDAFPSAVRQLRNSPAFPGA
jgi:cysteine desulfurase